MQRSARPWIPTRLGPSKVRTSSADPATRPQLQPRPMRNRPRYTPPESLASAPDAEAAPNARRIPPAAMTALAPKRSAALPTSGERAYMPMMCSEMTKPTTSRAWPPARRCRGVIVMMPTMTTCPATMEPTASRPAEVVASGRTNDLRRGRSANFPTPPDITSGSGRRYRSTTKAATANRMTESR